MIHLAGLNHKTSPVALRERLAAAGPERLREGLLTAGWGEAVVLSTCNRFEVYGAGGAAGALREVLERAAGGPLNGAVYQRSNGEAVRHLFGVAAGLDSMVLGEGEILGQVKAAYEAAREAGATGGLTNVLFQRAAFVGKQVRASTGIAAGHTSVASVAVELASRVFGELAACRALLLGAGHMAEKTALHLHARRVSALAVANRTFERGEALAERFGGRAVRWEAVDDALAEADIVVASTGAAASGGGPLLTRERVRAALRRRSGRPLFLIDIAMPRDVEESVHGLEGAYLYALGDLEAVVNENLASRQAELAKARELVEAAASAFEAWLRGRAEGRRVALRHAA